MWTTRPAPPVASFTTTPGAVVESEQVAIDVPPFTIVPLASSIDDSAVMVVGRPSQTGCEATLSATVPGPTTLDGVLPTKRSDSPLQSKKPLAQAPLHVPPPQVLVAMWGQTSAHFR